MDRVISFSIYGNELKYTVGLLRNLELSKQIYPDWVVYIYYNNTVPTSMIEQYEKFDNVKLFDMTDFPGPGVLWRFTPYDNVERFISRDSDSRLSMREKYAVDDWIDSGKSLHLMRDHPHHEAHMFAGMFGLVVDKSINLKEDIIKWTQEDRGGLFNKFSDTIFLKQFVYDRYIINNDIIEHNSISKKYIYSKPFPTPMENYKFIGEIYDENNNRYPQYSEWINKKEYRDAIHT